MKNKLITSLLLILSIQSFAQTKIKRGWKAAAALATTSALLYNDFSHTTQLEFRSRNFPDFYTPADTYLQYSPALMNIGLHAMGLKTKSDTKELVAKFVLGTGIYYVSAMTLKYVVNETRPNGEPYSFPSGHTTTAFFGAHSLAKEYWEEHPEIAVTGYVLATTTGILRVANNQHWASDVLMGAGLGIASAEAAYWIYPKLKKALNMHAIKWDPVIAPNYYVARLQVQF
jgi:membrane-associated phospholipid phosphatase